MSYAAPPTFPLLGGRLHLEDTRPLGLPNPSEDALWLAASLPPLPGGPVNVLDAGCGSGIAALALTRYQSGHPGPLNLTLLDRDPAHTALAVRNCARNGLTPHAVLTADLLTLPQPHAATRYTVILSNPPFHLTSHGYSTASAHKHTAHAITPANFTRWLAALTALLAPGGRLHLVTHTATAPLFGPGWQFVPLHTHPTRPAKRLIAHHGPTPLALTTIKAFDEKVRQQVLTDGLPLT